MDTLPTDLSAADRPDPLTALGARPGCVVPGDCPVTETLDVIGGKWKAVILFHLTVGPLRFSDLRRLIPGVTGRVLTAHLRELEADGVVRRTVFPTVPPRVDYDLTPLGATLRPILNAMAIWGDAAVRRRRARGRMRPREVAAPKP